jgi:hypothetical protein
VNEGGESAEDTDADRFSPEEDGSEESAEETDTDDNSNIDEDEVGVQPKYNKVTHCRVFSMHFLFPT